MFRLFKKSQHEEKAREIYARIVKQARRPEFYVHLGVPDTPDGRFDLILVNAFLVFHRMKTDHERTKDLGQAVFDLMFADMDQNLREMGVGDIGVSHRVKGMAKAFYGRVASYEAALSQASDDDLVAALKRNLFRKCSPEDWQVRRVASYLRRQSTELGQVPVDNLLSGEIEFAVSVETREAEGHD